MITEYNKNDSNDPNDPEGKYKVNTLEELEKIAEALGCTLYKGDINELLLDIDAGKRVNMDILPLVDEKFIITGQKSWKSRNGGIHVVIQLGQHLEPPERIALQAALGSDPKREAIATWEWFIQKTDTISLFKPINAIVTET